MVMLMKKSCVLTLLAFLPWVSIAAHVEAEQESSVEESELRDAENALAKAGFSAPALLEEEQEGEEVPPSNPLDQSSCDGEAKVQKPVDPSREIIASQAPPVSAMAAVSKAQAAGAAVPQKTVEAAVQEYKNQKEVDQIKEDAEDQKESSRLAAEIAKVSAKRGQKQAVALELKTRECELAEEAEEIKEEASSIAIKIQRAKAEVGMACASLKRVKEEEAHILDDVNKHDNLIECKGTAKKQNKDAQAKAAFDKSTKVAAKKVLAARKAAEFAAIAAGQCAEVAEAAGKKAQAAQAKMLAQQAAEVKIMATGSAKVSSAMSARMASEPHSLYDKPKGCLGWAPTSGKSAGKGATCDTFGWTRKWCWVGAGYTGSGHEFIQQSQEYEGKSFAPCSSRGSALDRYSAAWAATGCPAALLHTQHLTYEKQKDDVVLADMYSVCTSALPDKLKMCCGEDVDLASGCSPACKKQTGFPKSNSEGGSNGSSNGNTGNAEQMLNGITTGQTASDAISAAAHNAAASPGIGNKADCEKAVKNVLVAVQKQPYQAAAKPNICSGGADSPNKDGGAVHNPCEENPCTDAKWKAVLKKDSAPAKEGPGAAKEPAKEPAKEQKGAYDCVKASKDATQPPWNWKSSLAQQTGPSR